MTEAHAKQFPGVPEQLHEVTKPCVKPNRPNDAKIASCDYSQMSSIKPRKTNQCVLRALPFTEIGGISYLRIRSFIDPQAALLFSFERKVWIFTGSSALSIFCVSGMISGKLLLSISLFTVSSCAGCMEN